MEGQRPLTIFEPEYAPSQTGSDIENVSVCDEMYGQGTVNSYATKTQILLEGELDAEIPGRLGS